MFRSKYHSTYTKNATMDIYGYGHIYVCKNGIC